MVALTFLESCDCSCPVRFLQISVRFGAEVRYDDTLDLDEESRMLRKYTEARQHELFPDEVDTPLEVAARVRFQK